MASSDDEEEVVPRSVSNYHFSDDKNEPISFTVLPIQWGAGDGVSAKGKQVFLNGVADSGLQKVYKLVTAWKLDVSGEGVDISVLSKNQIWMKLQKPRRSYEEEVIRSILITIHCLQYSKKNPDALDKVVWDYLHKTFSKYEVRPSKNDLLDHLSLIRSMVERDEGLAKSKFLISFLEAPKKRNISDEDLQTESDPKKSKFIVDDGDDEMDAADEDESDEELDSFDSVCAICDNGGELLCCEGKCLRSFHATKDAGAESQCASLGMSEAQVDEIQNFLCTNCKYKQHQCFACGKLGSSDKTSGAEVFSCVNATCGYFYHPECVAKLLHRGNDTEAAEHQKRIAAGESFTCPVHKCVACKKGENKEVEELQFAVCRRCPTSYHRKCLPREIAFEDEEDEDTIQRAWDHLIPNRILLYCLKHPIDEDLGTPPRNHIKFPNIVEQKKVRSLEKVKKKDVAKDSMDEKISTLLQRKVGEKRAAEDGNSATLTEKTSKATAASKKPLKDAVFPKLPKSSAPEDNNAPVREKSVNSMPSKGSDSVKPTPKDLPSDMHKPLSASSVVKTNTSPPILDGETEKKILGIVKRSSSSLTLEGIMKMQKVPSTHTYTSRHLDKIITQGKVERYVEALQTALQKLENGCSLEDAKDVCEPGILNQILKWKNRLKVYLSPFIHGMRYTSFGRHFTKVEKLKEIVEKLHPYVQNGDMIVDFCCGANDFSRLMKEKLEGTGKKCSFKNYDVIQPKHDFCFEKRDWMTVRPKELPTGSQLIMGLNPPFGVKAALANKFIDKALEFKPKLLILIVPKETGRLDEKKQAYDLIWENDDRLTGKSFYLPGSIDVHDKQMEQWNLKPPLLYLWSRPDWTKKHRAIAIRQGHITEPHEESVVKENHEEARVQDQGEDCDPYGDISKILNDISALNKKVTEEALGTVSHQERTKNSPAKDDSHTDQSKHDDNDQTESNVIQVHRKNKRSHDSPRERERRRKPPIGKDEISEGKYRRTQGDESRDRETPTSISSLANGNDSRSYLEDRPAEAYETPFGREGSREGAQRFKHGISGSTSEFGTRYSGTHARTPDEELDVIERRYRNRDDPLISGAWSNSSSSGFRGLGGQFSSYTNEPTIDSFNRNPYMDKLSRSETYERQGVNPAEYGQSKADLLRKVHLYGQLDHSGVLQRNRPALGQDSGFGPTGSVSSPFAPSSLSSDMSRRGTSVTQRYAPRLDEMNFTRSDAFPPAETTPVGSNSFSSVSGSQAGIHSDLHGFASGPHRHYPHHNSSGWLND